VSDITQLQGDIVAGFKMLRLLGRGGNGAVYLARQLSVDKIAACKILFPHLVSDPVYIKNFVHEARLAARLEHPNIIQALDVGCDGNLSYFIMEYVPGKSLEKIRTTEPERITLPFLLDISIALAGALDHAWKKFHVFHGDIKPDNLLIRDGDGILKLADLGLAKIVGKDDLATDIMATPLYASPEVILADASNIGIKSDIYSFGIMLYELLTGKAPFRGNVESVLRQHVDKDPVPLEKASPGLDRELAAFINRMIAKAPADRPHDWEEIKNVLQQIRARTPDSGKSKSSRRIPGKQVLSLILSIIFLILAAGIAFAVFKLF
jgi:serine/threonine-protein kinase